MADARQMYQVVIRAPVEAVWAALTKTDEVLPFFFGSVMRTPGLKPGAPMRMRSPNDKYTGVVGEVLEFDPPRRFSHTFRFTNYDDAPCRVTYELRPVPEGTEFTLITEGVPAGTRTEKQMAQGGPFITQTLKQVVERGRPSFGTRMILRLIRVMEPFTPKRCLSSNWP
jgi:uncharacterized protein YndB with AHSA1/START domain